MSSEHYEARKGLITATDIAKLANGGPAAWRVVKETKQGGGREIPRTRAMQWGLDREAEIVDFLSFYEDLTPNSEIVVREGTNHASTPDAVGDRVGAEVKTTRVDWQLRDGAHLREVRPDYYDQVQWQIYTCDFDRVLFGYEPHRDYEPLPKHYVVVARDQERIDELVAIAAQFAEYLVTEEQVGEFDDLLAEYKVASDALVEAEEAVKAVRARIQERIGEREELSVKTVFGSFTWQTPKPRVSLDSTLLKSELPDVFEKYSKVSESKPVLRVIV